MERNVVKECLITNATNKTTLVMDYTLVSLVLLVRITNKVNVTKLTKHTLHTLHPKLTVLTQHARLTQDAKHTLHTQHTLLTQHTKPTKLTKDAKLTKHAYGCFVVLVNKAHIAHKAYIGKSMVCGCFFQPSEIRPSNPIYITCSGVWRALRALLVLQPALAE